VTTRLPPRNSAKRSCTTLKNRGITIAVLYIPYQTIQNPANFANSEDIYTNSNIPNIPGALQSCASPNFYYTANTASDITSALIAQAVSTAHVTQWRMSLIERRCPRLVADVPILDPLQKQNMAYLNSSPALPGGRVSSC